MHDVWPHLRSSSERGAVRCAAAERELQFFARRTVVCSMHGMEFLYVDGLKPPTNIRHQTTRNICLHTSGTLGTCEFNKGSEVPGYVIVLSTTVSPGILSQPRKMCCFSFFRTDNALYQCFSSKEKH